MNFTPLTDEDVFNRRVEKIRRMRVRAREMERQMETLMQSLADEESFLANMVRN